MKNYRYHHWQHLSQLSFTSGHWKSATEDVTGRQYHRLDRHNKLKKHWRTLKTGWGSGREKNRPRRGRFNHLTRRKTACRNRKSRCTSLRRTVLRSARLVNSAELTGMMPDRRNRCEFQQGAPIPTSIIGPPPTYTDDSSHDVSFNPEQRSPAVIQRDKSAFRVTIRIVDPKKKGRQAPPKMGWRDASMDDPQSFCLLCGIGPYIRHKRLFMPVIIKWGLYK